MLRWFSISFRLSAVLPGEWRCVTVSVSKCLQVSPNEPLGYRAPSHPIVLLRSTGDAASWMSDFQQDGNRLRAEIVEKDVPRAFRGRERARSIRAILTLMAAHTSPPTSPSNLTVWSRRHPLTVDCRMRSIQKVKYPIRREYPAGPGILRSLPNSRSDTHKLVCVFGALWHSAECPVSAEHKWQAECPLNRSNRSPVFLAADHPNDHLAKTAAGYIVLNDGNGNSERTKTVRLQRWFRSLFCFSQCSTERRRWAELDECQLAVSSGLMLICCVAGRWGSRRFEQVR